MRARLMSCSFVIITLIVGALDLLLPLAAAGQSASFLPQATYQAGTCPTAVVTGDFNGDGIPDLATADYNGQTISILSGQGDGTFGAPTSVPLPNHPSDLIAADFNRDGATDLAYFVSGSYPSNGVFVLLGNGNGTFAAAQAVSGVDFPASIAVGDLNRDGMVDLVVAGETVSAQHTYSEAVWVFLGNGDGTFQPPYRWVWGWGTAGSASCRAIADFDRDGIPDVACTNHDFASILFGNGDGTFQPARQFATGQGDWGNLVVADFNGDGILDVAATPSLSVLIGKGDGTFQSVQTFQPPVVSIVGDFNGDGMPDLAGVEYSANTVSVFINNVPPPGSIWMTPVNALAGQSSLRKMAGCDGCPDAGAITNQGIASGGAYVEFTVPDASLMFVAGLTHAFPATDSAYIDFGIRAQDGWVEVRENDVYQSSTTVIAGDAFRITIDASSGVVSYAKNGAAFYTSAASPTFPLVFAAALYNLNASLTGVTLGVLSPPSGGSGATVIGCDETAKVTTRVHCE